MTDAEEQLRRDLVRERDRRLRLESKLPLGVAVTELVRGEPLAFLQARIWRRLEQLPEVRAILDEERRA